MDPKAGGFLTRFSIHLNWCVPQWRSSGSSPCSSGKTKLLTLSLRESLSTLPRKLNVGACIRNLIILVMTISGSQEKEWRGNGEIRLAAQLSLQLDGLVQSMCIAANSAPILSLRPPLVNRNPWGSSSFSTEGEHSIPPQLRTITWDSQGLIGRTSTLPWCEKVAKLESPWCACVTNN